MDQVINYLEIADFNFELIFCFYVKALCYSVIAERIMEEFAKSLHPDITALKRAQESLIEASKICEFLSNQALLLVPQQLKTSNQIIPELNSNIMLALSKLFYAEAQLVAFERGCKSPDKKLSYSARASLLKDVVILLRTSWEMFDKGFYELKSNAQSSMKVYYVNFIKGLTLFCDAWAWFNFGLKFQDEQPNGEDNEYSRKMRLGCEKISIEIFKEFEEKYYKQLERHRSFFETNLKKIYEQLVS